LCGILNLDVYVKISIRDYTNMAKFKSLINITIVS